MTSLANIGVLVGLAVLIYEIRQTNELTMAQIEQSRSESFLNWRQELALNDHLAPLFAKADQLFVDTYGEYDDSISAAEYQEQFASVIEMLEPADQYRIVFASQRSYWDFENLYFQYRRGLVSENYWNERIVPAIVQDAPAWKAISDGNLLGGRKEFNDEVERILSAEE